MVIQKINLKKEGLEALSINDKLTVRMVAGLLDTDENRVRRLINDGKLDAIEYIFRYEGKNRKLISVPCENLLKIREEGKKCAETITRALFAKIPSKKPAMYGELLETVGMTHTNPYHRQIIGKILSVVTEKSYSQCTPTGMP